MGSYNKYIISIIFPACLLHKMADTSAKGSRVVADGIKSAATRKRPLAGEDPATKSSKTMTNDIVAFTKAVSGLTRALENTDKMVEAVQRFDGEVLHELQTKLEAARHAFQAEENEMEQTRKRRKLDHELTIQAHGREYAIKLLEEEGYAAVRAEQYDHLQQKLAEAQAQLATIKEHTTEHVLAAATKDHEMAMDRVTLTNEAKVAQLTEQNKLLNVQIIELKQTIHDLRQDVQSTQEIVKTFASKPTIVRTNGDK